MSESGPFYPEGFYLVDVTAQGYQRAKTGKPMIVFTVQPIAQLKSFYGDDGGLIEQETAVTKRYDRTVRLVIVEDNEQALDFAMQKLRYAGFKGDRFEDLNLVGSTVRCTVSHRPYEGKTYEQWDLALPPRESSPIESDNSIPKTLNALFGRRLKNNDSPKPPAPSTVPESQQVGDDDIPFAFIPFVVGLLALGVLA